MINFKGKSKESLTFTDHPTVMKTTIRQGIKSDLPQVLELIRELAAYEKAPDEVTVTVADMERDGFGEQPVFRFFVAEHEGRIIGISLYYIKYSTWKGTCVFLEDLVVTEAFRCHGIGKLLFDEVAKVAKNMGVQRMEWQVLEWNAPAIAFYKKLNAVLDEEWVNCKLTYSQLQAY